MGARNQQGGQGRSGGFTIIEVVLFLAITGVLAVALLGGWTTMINTQRYKDSVKTLQSFIQQQYNLVYNVENGRTPDLSCAGSVVDDIGPSSARGQSNCVLMGRFISIEDGSKLTVRAIVGKDLDEDNTSTSDIDIIRDSDPRLIPEDIDIGLTYSSLNVPWGASIVDELGNPRTMSIAILRSSVKVSGSVHTYTVTGTTSDIENMVNIGNERNDVPLCIDPGNSFSGGRLGVVIRAQAGSQSAIQTLGDEGGLCG